VKLTVIKNKVFLQVLSPSVEST